MTQKDLHYKCLECGDIDTVVVNLTMGWNGEKQEWENLYWGEPMDERCQCGSWDVETFRGEYKEEDYE